VPDWVQINMPGVNSVARGIVGHRGISHWVLTAMAIGGLAGAFASWLALPVLAGWVSHIVLDILSGGVSALWPWPGRITLAKIKTSTWQDAIVGAACLVLAIVMVVVRAI
jgi:inner membrane protein